jgi:hypothetical protein
MTSLVSGVRRTVRATPDFFAHLDLQLPAERGPHGEPSSVDFQAYELLEIVERFATGWDYLPELIPGRPDYRILIINGRLVPMISAIGQLARDGAIELTMCRCSRSLRLQVSGVIHRPLQIPLPAARGLLITKRAAARDPARSTRPA